MDGLGDGYGNSGEQIRIFFRDETMHQWLYAASLVGLSLYSAASSAQPPPGADIKPLPYSSGSLHAMMVLTSDLEAARRAWQESASSPKMITVTQARPGDNVSTLIMLHGCTPDQTGRCNVDAAFRLEVPGGEQFEAGRGKLWSADPLSGLLVLGNASASLVVAPDWAPGQYVFHALVLDRVANATLALSAPFEVLGRPEATP